MRGILTYHSLDDSGSPISVRPGAFRRHVEWLAGGGAPVRTLAEIAGGADGIALTFDDAFVNFREVAWPLLREHGFPVTVFVPTDHAGKTNRWPDEVVSGVPELPLLDLEALGKLAAEGVELGSHTMSHRDLRKLSAEELERELVGAADVLERETGRSPEALAYPYGFQDDRVAAAARNLYARAVTVEFRKCRGTEDPLRLPRLDAYYFQAAGTLERWGTWRLNAYLAARSAGRAARGVLERVGLVGG